MFKSENVGSAKAGYPMVFFKNSMMLALLLTILGASQINAQVIYDNGSLATGATSNSGVAAPAGTQWSEAQNPYGNTVVANTSAGASCSLTATVFRCADDFNIPVGQTWTINQVLVFAYQTGFSGSTSPITAGTLQIWKGRPGDAGSTIVFGDTTTNRLATSTNSGLFRIFNTVVGAAANPPTAPGTTRIIWQNNLNVSPAAVLTAGNYWIDWNTSVAASGAHFSPNSSYPGTRGVPGANARQNTAAAWGDVTDTGQTPTGNPTPTVIPQDFPFKLTGSVAGAPLAPRSRALDFDGDNKSDLVIVRSATAVSQSTWYVSKTTGGTLGADWGQGAGFSAGDKVTPADFDGDGKTDIAVWRPGAAGAFYIFQSATATVKIQNFGVTGDDSSVIGDYDGDGKADIAVWREGVGGDQSRFYYQKSSSPSGIYSLGWGSAGDRAIPGDFDGDGKFDFCVARATSGQWWFYTYNSATATSNLTRFGASTDKIATGDFDGDGRTDLYAIRSNAGALDWYILKSSTGEMYVDTFGSATSDLIAVGDYDGDNKSDLAVWRSQIGASPFITRNTRSSPFTTIWGQSTGVGVSPDYPVANFSVK